MSEIVTNINDIVGCGLGVEPMLIREDGEIICKSWQGISRGNKVEGQSELDSVDENAGTAVCKHSQCNHLTGEVK